MSAERASVLERLSSAMGGGGDADVVGALGMAQAAPGDIGRHHARGVSLVGSGIGSEAQISAIGAHLTRLQSSVGALGAQQARQSIAELVRRLDVSRRWGLTDPQLARVTDSALLLHLSPRCTPCSGRGYALIPGTPTKGENACPVCAGSGQRPYPRRHASEVRAVLNVLEWIQNLMERAVARRMR